MNFNQGLIGVMTTAMVSLQGCGLFRTETNEPLPGSVRVDFEVEWEGQPYGLGEVVQDHLGHPLRLDNLQLYLAPLSLLSSEEEWIEGSDVTLLDFTVHGQRLSMAFPPGTYSEIQLGLGIPPELNTDIDPASYPNDHPLSVIGSAGMFWTWASGYIFLKYEGKFALESGSQLLEPLSYHCGTDASYRTVVLSLPEPITLNSQETKNLIVTLDAAHALAGVSDSIDIATDPVTHNANGDSLGARMMDLMVNAWKVEL